MAAPARIVPKRRPTRRVRTVPKFWRAEDPVLGEEGTVEIGGMFEHQRRWWGLPNFIKAMVAGYGAGKTLIGSKRAIAMSLLNNGQPHFWVSPSYKVAKRTVVPTLIELLDGKKTVDKGLRYKYNKSDNEFLITHRGRTGRIWIGSGEEPDSLKGPNVGTATIDEPFIQDEAVFLQMLARVRAPKAKHREIGLLGTPEQLNWGYDICEGEDADRYDIGMINVATSANLALPQQYIDTLLAGYTARMKQAFFDGQFINLSKGAIYYGFSRHRNIVRLEDPGHELLVGMDFNVDPMAAIVFWVNGKHMHIVAEIEIENADTQYMADILSQNNEGTNEEIVKGQIRNFLDKEGAMRVRTIYPDASGRARSTNSPGGTSDFTILRTKFEVISKSANPKIRDRENAVNGKLNPARGRPTLTIDPACKKIQKYMHAYTHELRLKQKQYSHLLDALGYPTAYLYPVVKPRVTISTIKGF
jgi:Terminase large subunit, T4likevirus-type, N-terminal